jgi:hypothetical protein
MRRDFRKFCANTNRVVGLSKDIQSYTSATGLYFFPYGIPIIFAELTLPTWSELQARIEQQVVA